MLIIATKPVPLATLVANPFTGNVDLALNQEAVNLFGPNYIPLLRQQLQHAAKIVEEIEVNAYKDPK